MEKFINVDDHEKFIGQDSDCSFDYFVVEVGLTEMSFKVTFKWSL